jgi:hypothetical protein
MAAMDLHRTSKLRGAAGALLLFAIGAGASCLLPNYTDLGPSSTTEGAGTGGAASTSASSGSGSGGSTSASGAEVGLTLSPVWQQSAKGTSNATGAAVFPDSSGAADKIVVSGKASAFDMGSSCQVSMSGARAFVAHLDADGTCTSFHAYGDGNTTSRTVVADKDGNAYFGGQYRDKLTVGTEASSSSNAFSPFVAREESWVKGRVITLAPGAERQTFALAYSASDNAIVATGQSLDDLSFGTAGQTQAFNAYAFVVRISTGSAPLWIKRFDTASSSGFARGQAIAVTDAIYVAGDFKGTLKIDDTVTLTGVSSQDIFLASLAMADGSRRWAKGLGASSLASPNAMVVSGAHILVAGGARGALTLDGDACITTGSGLGGFVASFGTSDGKLEWCAGFAAATDADEITPTGIGVDASGNAWVGGSFKGSADLGAGLQSSAGGSTDVFLLKLDATTGKPLGSVSYGDSAEQHVRSLAVDAAGNVILAGDFLGTIDFGAAEPLTNPLATPSAFVAKLSP